MIRHDRREEADIILSAENHMMAVLFARSREEAEAYCSMLENVAIPAFVGDGTGAFGHGVPVLVPETDHDRASEVLASYEAAKDGSWDGEDDSEEEEFEDVDDDEEVFPDDDDDFDDDDDDDDDDEFFDDDEDDA